MESLNQKNLNLNIFNGYGIYIGSFYASTQKNRMKCLLKQVEIYQTRTRIEYAKKIDIASLHNRRANLRYDRNHVSEDRLEKGIGKISNEVEMMKKEDTINDVLLLEARCQQEYYACFNQMVFNEEFHISGRNRRPP